MAIVICITNQKGGVGKTTTAVNLGYYLAKDRYRTLIVDIDPQGNATSGLGIDKSSLNSGMVEVMLGSTTLEKAILKTKYKHLDILPTTPELANTEVELVSKKNRFSILKNALARIADHYDYIIICRQ